MSLFYSAATRGFYDDEVHAELPADAVPITAARHAELIAAQETGAEIVPSDRGTPIIHRHKPTAEELRAKLLAETDREANRRILAISPIWQQMNDMRQPSDAGMERFVAIDAVRAASNAVERAIAACPAAQLTDFTVSTHTLWPEDVS